MDDSEDTAPENFSSRPSEMAKETFELINFISYVKCPEEQRAIIMYTETEEPKLCPHCGNIHLTLNEFYYHYN
jgi:hypothetical protein